MPRARGDDHDARIVVLGAGAAGSVLVQALATAGVPGPVLLVDDGTVPIEDRVWASWVPFGRRDGDPAVSSSWRRLVVASERGERVLALTRHRYVAVRGRDLRDITDDALRTVGGQRLDAHGHAIHDADGTAVVRTTAGDLRARLVLDSVGLLPPRRETARGWMAFDGCEVVADRPVFDPDRMRLMDFRVPQRGGAAFAYTLPWTADRALVELTRIGAGAEPAPTGADLGEHLDRTLGVGRYRVVRREAGVLPLRPRVRRPRSPHCLAIGAPAGLVRASTGYGYQRMRRDAARIAAALARGERPRGMRRSARHEAMDAVLLDLVERDPATVVRSLELLFARNPADLVLRFLDEDTSLAEEARLVSSLPTAPFVAAALGTGLRAAYGSRSRKGEP
ncbi:MAG TPA: lycopene cyclase family protein [Candidatus Angelobacter sp.]|nr:lycopene cyclase family protein [Candidatus Angelobacter sp.]